MKSNIVNIDWIDKSDRCAIVPGYINSKKAGRLKELFKAKGNCYFTSGIAYSLIDFIYRAVIQLKIKDKKLIFSRGAVKINGKSVLHSLGIRELNWDVGVSIRIPQKLNYNKKIRLIVDDKEHELRLMEIIVLSGLLHIAYPRKSSKLRMDQRY